MDSLELLESEECRELEVIIRKCLEENPSDHFAGNCLYYHKMDFKVRGGENANNLRHNLYQLGKRSSSLLEIGCNGGHSAMIFRKGNPDLNIICFDLCLHSYTKPCMEYLKIPLIVGDSTVVVPEYPEDKKYDIIHIDGSHKVKDAYADLNNCYNLSHSKTLVVFDDANFPNLKRMLDRSVETGLMEDIDYSDYPYLRKTIYHRIMKYAALWKQWYMSLNRLNT